LFNALTFLFAGLTEDRKKILYMMAFGVFQL